MDGIANAKALITGASGFLGSSLARQLASMGARVIGVSRRPHVGADHEWRTCDLEDAKAVSQLFDETRPDYIFHLASYVTGARDLKTVLPTFRANVAAAVHVLSAACETGCRRIVLAGSMEELPDDQPARYPYAVAKRAAAEYGRFFHAAYGLPVVSARIAMVYGPGQRDTGKVMPHVIISQLDGLAPRLSSGKRRVDWVHVQDVVRALIACATVEGVDGSVVEIGSGRLTSVREVAERLTALTGGPEPDLGALPDRANDVEAVMDTATTAQRIGWRAEIDLAEGLRQTVSWFRSERSAGRL